MKRSRTGRMRYPILLLSAAALAWWAHQRGRPQRLLELPVYSTLPPLVCNGYIVWTSGDGIRPGRQLRSMPVTGGADREIADRVLGPVSIVGGSVYYVRSTASSEAPAAAGTPRNGTAGGTGLVYRASPQRPAKPVPMGMARSSGTNRASSVPPPRLALCRVPARGGRVESRPLPANGQAVIVAERAYWTEWAVYRSELCEQIRSAPLAGGRAQALMTVLAGGAELSAGTHGAYARVSDRTFPAAHSHRALFYMDNRTGKARKVLEDYRGGLPVEAGGRLYWLESAADGSGALMTAGMDGSDARVVMEPGSSALLSDLTTHRGGLYVRLREGPPDRNTGAPYSRSTLCRVSLEGRPRVQRLLTVSMPASPGCFDDGFYYFVAEESRENWLDWSARGLQVQHSHVLYRYRLPD